MSVLRKRIEDGMVWIRWDSYRDDKNISLLAELLRQWSIDKDANIFMLPLAQVIAEEYDHGYAFKDRLKEALKVFGQNGVVSEDIFSKTTVVCNF